MTRNDELNALNDTDLANEIANNLDLALDLAELEPVELADPLPDNERLIRISDTRFVKIVITVLND